MADEPEDIQKEMEKTRTSLTEKLEAIEGQVSNTISTTSEVVQDTTQSVQTTVSETVDAVKDTVESVTEKVQETFQAVTDTFDLSLQIQRRPWVIIGGAFAVGCVLGAAFTSSETLESQTTDEPDAPTSRFTDEEASSDQGMWGNAFSHLRNLGLSYLMGMARNLVQNELPAGLGERVADEIDSLTSRLGGTPMEKGEIENSDEDSSADENSGEHSNGNRTKGATSDTNRPTDIAEGHSRIRNLTGSKGSK